MVQVSSAQLPCLVIPAPQGPTVSESVNPLVAKQMRQKGTEDGKIQATSEFNNSNLVVLAVRRDRLTPEDLYLETKYGIHTFFLNPTNTTYHLMGWIEGYNSTIGELLTVRFGTNVFTEAKQMVREKREQKVQQAVPGYPPQGVGSPEP